jgi:hypothetical protein
MPVVTSFVRVASVLTDLFHSTVISYALAPQPPRAILLFFGCGTQLRCVGWGWSGWIWWHLDLGFGFMGAAAMEVAEKA